jgi:ATP-dependent protease ClpP protease subunit
MYKDSPIVRTKSENRVWYRIENHGTSADIYIYDEIGWFGCTAQDFVAALSQVNSSQMTLHINSPGGDVWDGIAIYNALLSHPAKVDVVVDGLAASIASVIAMAGDTVKMGVGAQMMVHEASGGAFGPAGFLRQTADLLDKATGNIAAFYARKAGGTVEDWLAVMAAETWYNADEAVSAGLADSIVEPAVSPVPVNRWDLSIFNYAGRDAAPAPMNIEPPAPPEPETVDVGSLISRAIREAMQ